MNIIIRKATPADKDFITEAIIEVEKSGTELISYCSIFSISESKFREVLSNILDEDMEGQELCISGYLVAEVDGERAAVVCAWIEMENEMTSNMIKSNLLMHFLDSNTIHNAAPTLKLMNEIDIPRDENALQLEITYTAAKYRGLGLYGKLINEHIRLRQESSASFDKIQVIILKDNVNPMRALTRLGFTKALEKHCADKGIFNILPSDTKILMEKKLKSA